MKKSTLLFASVTLAGTLLVGCAGETEEAAEEAVTEEAVAEESTAEEVVEEEAAPEEDVAEEEVVEETETQEVTDAAVEGSDTALLVADYQAIMAELGKMKEDQPVDWALVESTYANELKSAAADFDNFIASGINAGTSEELDPNVARQLIDKGIQSFFYQYQKDLQSEAAEALAAGDQEAANATFAELNYLVDTVFIPTAEKRDAFYELAAEDSIVGNIENGLALQQEALEAGNAEDFAVYKQVTDKSIYRSYYLASNSYVEKIAQAVAEGNADPADLQIMQAEALGFYQAIQGSLSGGDEEAAAELQTLFDFSTTDPATLDPEAVEALFSEAFIAKIAGYHQKAADTVAAGDIATARIQAMEANVFLKAIELDLIEELGEEQTATLLEEAQLWYEAIANGDAEAAAAHSEAIVPVITGLVE
ncbi:hypothetical protein [Planococcus lenghuensis]|uniref:Copper amine oxidase n=1 Tax=Planococcus lenghuensis TaxID=2213202 RepID=A0A1Q2KZ99_9BACL|nr:hypothetical protein [Planococcus lenghuensis]AQQ53454.1 hypothetical protein B0X71_10465 [Planococcus lenghuensis]